MEVRLDRPWLVLDLGAPHVVASSAIHRGGRVTARRIAWREVRDADLGPELDAVAWFAATLHAAGLGDAVGLVTSRDIRRFRRARAETGGVVADCIATVGLGNAERVGARHAPAKFAGTVNVALRCSAALSEAAQLEALSVAASARTLAVLEAGLRTPAGPATGTGTDCLAVAVPPGGAEPHAGLHTAAGEAIGRAVLEAVRDGAAEWLADRAAGRLDRG